MTDDTKDVFRNPLYEVGYRKPPENRRFAKGRSGNPKGRPKKTLPKPTMDRSTRESILNISKWLVTIREGEETKKVPLIDAAIQKLGIIAAGGNVPALRTFVGLVERSKKELDAEINGDHEFWRKYTETYEALLKAGRPIPDHWPHPKDLVFEDDFHVKLRGGGDPAVAAHNRQSMIKFRDLFLLQAEKDRRSFVSKSGRDEHPPLFVSEYLVTLINSCLPMRMQLSETQLQFQMWTISCLRKHKLEERLRMQWAEVGIPEARNLITPPIKPLLAQLGIDLFKLLGSRDDQTRGR